MVLCSVFLSLYVVSKSRFLKQWSLLILAQWINNETFYLCIYVFTVLYFSFLNDTKNVKAVSTD